MCVQLLDLSFDGRVHLVKDFCESADFVLTVFGLEFFDVKVSFGDL